MEKGSLCNSKAFICLNTFISKVIKSRNGFMSYFYLKEKGQKKQISERVKVPKGQKRKKSEKKKGRIQLTKKLN